MALTWSPTRSHPFSPHQTITLPNPHGQVAPIPIIGARSVMTVAARKFVSACAISQTEYPSKKSYPSTNLKQNTRIRNAAGPIVLHRENRWCTCTAGSRLANEKTHTDIGSTIVFFKEHPFHDLSRRRAPVAGAHKVCVFGAWER